jgi:hypothetical protein
MIVAVGRLSQVGIRHVLLVIILIIPGTLSRGSCVLSQIMRMISIIVPCLVVVVYMHTCIDYVKSA